MGLGILLNIIGISLEILGFIILIKSTRVLLQLGKAGLFDKQDPDRREETGRMPDVLGTNHPKIFQISIIVVMIGLIFQIFALFAT